MPTTQKGGSTAKLDWAGWEGEKKDSTRQWARMHKRRWATSKHNHVRLERGSKQTMEVMGQHFKGRRFLRLSGKDTFKVMSSETSVHVAHI